jgi:hypothetical protein
MFLQIWLVKIQKNFDKLQIASICKPQILAIRIINRMRCEAKQIHPKMIA